MTALIVMLVCAVNNPNECKSVGLPLFGDVTTAHGCYAIAQFKMAEWAVEHEGWTIRRFNCDTNQTAGERT